MDASPSHLLSLYDRRMTVGECFRDSEGARLGWTRDRAAAKPARSMLLVGLAMPLWTVTGLAAADHDKSLRLVSASKGPRQSWPTNGLRYAALGQRPPPDDLRLERLPRVALRRIAGPDAEERDRRSAGGELPSRQKNTYSCDGNCTKIPSYDLMMHCLLELSTRAHLTRASAETKRVQHVVSHPQKSRKYFPAATAGWSRTAPDGP